MGVKISILSMQRVAEGQEGYELLTQAKEEKAKTVLQRVPPQTSEDDDRGGFILMFLDWEQGLILHVESDFDAYEEFLGKVKAVFAVSVLDTFNLEGAKVN